MESSKQCLCYNRSRRHFSGEVLKWKSLRERCYGDLERRPNAELKVAAAAAGVEVMRYTPEGGETLDQMFARIKVWIQKLNQLMEIFLSMF